MFVIPFPGGDAENAVTATAFAPTPSGPLVLPSEFLRGLAGQRVLFQLALYLSRGSAGVIEATLAFVDTGGVVRETATELTVRQADDGFVRRLGTIADVSKRLQREGALAPVLVARVDSGSGIYMAPTLLVLRQD